MSQKDLNLYSDNKSLSGSSSMSFLQARTRWFPPSRNILYASSLSDAKSSGLLILIKQEIYQKCLHYRSNVNEFCELSNDQFEIINYVDNENIPLFPLTLYLQGYLVMGVQ